MGFDFLWFLIVDASEVFARVAFCSKKLVELSVDGLRVSVLSALDE
jgi:hypothetical protein